MIYTITISGGGDWGTPHELYVYEKNFFRYFFESLFDKGIFDQHNYFKDANFTVLLKY